MNSNHRDDGADGFRTTVATAREARTFVTANLLAGEELQTVETVRLLVSELVSNALQHDPDVPVGLELGLADAHTIRVEVIGGHVDPASLGDPSAWQVASPADATGRGLGIVAALAHDVSVTERDGLLVVRCHVVR